MTAVPPSVAEPPASRAARAIEWTIVIGLAAMLGWTTLCLGGYLAETLVWTSRAVWLLAALGAIGFGLAPRPLDLRVWWPVPFLVFALISVGWIAPARWLAWREWLLWFQAWIVFALVLHFGRTRTQTWTLVGTLLALGVVGVAMAAYQRFVDPRWMMLGRVQAEQFIGRSAGMFGIPNSLAGLLELGLPLCLVLLGGRAVPAAGKVLLGWVGALAVVGLVLTGSRGGWLGTAVALALWPGCTSRSWRRGALGALAVLAAVGAGLGALYLGSEYARARIDPFLAGEFERSRPIIWKVGLRIWQDAPWLGTGAASYNVVFDRYRPEHFRNEPDWTHNDYLNTLSDYGVVGFVLAVGAGAALLGSAWRDVKRRRRAGVGPGTVLDSWRGRLGLWLGLIAFAAHLAVDFHTKIPALAFAAAFVLALVLRRDSAAARGPTRASLALAALPMAVVLLVCMWRAERLYQAEALRFESRRQIDRIALGQSSLDRVVPPALAKFQQAVKVDPANAEAWGDLSYAVALSWHVTQGDVVAVGRRAEVAARRALALCPIVAEFWVHQGVAVDMQGRRSEAGEAFRQALSLAPNNAEWHYYYAHHLSVQPERRAEALAAVEICLSLDPANAQAKSLRTRLSAAR